MISYPIHFVFMSVFINIFFIISVLLIQAQSSLICLTLATFPTHLTNLCPIINKISQPEGILPPGRPTIWIRPYKLTSTIGKCRKSWPPKSTRSKLLKDKHCLQRRKLQSNLTMEQGEIWPLMMQILVRLLGKSLHLLLQRKLQKRPKRLPRKMILVSVNWTYF